jgi:hypothetical protein
MMDVTTLFTQINSAYRGTDDDAPTIGTTDGDMWLATANRKQAEWASDLKNVWQSNFLLDKPNELGTVATTATTTLTGTGTYFTDYRIGDTITVSGETVRTIATITSNTVLTVTLAFSNTASALTFTHASIVATAVQTYSLHRSLLNPSDKVIVSTTDEDISYTIGKPAERARYASEAYIYGRQPKSLTFYTDFVSTDQAIGGTIGVPGYYIPADMTAATDIVSVDDPYWLVYSVASELAFNDITYSDKSPDLNAKANNLYSMMVTANRRGSSNNPRVAYTNVQRIEGPNNERFN